MTEITTSLLTLAALFVIVNAVLWFFLPFAIFGMKKIMLDQLEQLQLLKNMISYQNHEIERRKSENNTPQQHTEQTPR